MSEWLYEVVLSVYTPVRFQLFHQLHVLHFQQGDVVLQASYVLFSPESTCFRCFPASSERQNTKKKMVHAIIYIKYLNILQRNKITRIVIYTPDLSET